MNTPKISVIMPTYNTPEKFFKQAIDSILNQTYNNLELIIVDDGSESQHIEQVAKSYNDKRVIYLNHGHNGAGPARNIGIKHATGDYIYIMASDDTLDLDTFEVCIDLANTHNTDIVIFNLYGAKETNKIHKYKHPVPLGITNPGDTTKLYKRKLITDNNIEFENLTYCNDLTFTFTALAYAKNAVKIERSFYHYNTNVPNQISTKRGTKPENVFMAFDALQRNLNKGGKRLFRKYKKVFYRIFTTCVKYELSFISDTKRKAQILDFIKTKHPKVYRRVFDYKFKLVGKQRFDNGKRSIYICGKKIYSYCKNFSTDLSVFDIEIKKYHAYIANQEQIETLVLGSSTARDGFLPEHIFDFNLGTSSQDLYRTYNLYKWCTQQNSKSLKNIIVFFDVFTPGLQLEKTATAYRTIVYKQLYNIPYAFKLKRMYKHFEKLCKNYFNTYQAATDDYYGQSAFDVQDNPNYIQDTAQKHMKHNQRNNNQIAYLEKLILLAKQNNHNVYVVVPPYRADYRQYLPENKIVFQELNAFIEKHSQVTLLNFFDDTRFEKNDFNDCHHLNKNGATKLTGIIKQFIK